jgi:hypothetical protein
LEIINEEVNGGQATRSAVEGGPMGKVVSKTNNATAISKAMADRTKLSVRDDNSLSYGQHEDVSLMDNLVSCLSSCSLEGAVKRFRYLLYQIVMNQVYSTLILTLIVLNTIILALDSYPIDTTKEQAFDRIN